MVNELVSIYKCDPSMIITYESKPIMVREAQNSQSNAKQSLIKLMLIPEDKK